MRYETLKTRKNDQEIRQLSVKVSSKDYERILKLNGQHVKVGPFIRDVLASFLDKQEQQQKAA